MQHLFFCGPKRLAKIPQVCKAWKSLSDTVSETLWANAYLAKYKNYRWLSPGAEQRYLVATGAIPPITFSESPTTENTIERRWVWKDVFIRKQIAEKIVGFKRNPRTGYKHRICNYIGCLEILKSANQERKHDKIHLRLMATKQRLPKKSQKRK